MQIYNMYIKLELLHLYMCMFLPVFTGSTRVVGSL